MLIFELISWWYGQGWLHIVKSFNTRLIHVAHFFSVPILLRTLWAPWRRIITYPGAGLDARLRALGDNLVSRCIGFTVRMLVLVAAGVLILLAALIGALLIIIWPLIPLMTVLFVIKGITG